jgi:rhamnosyltransferase
VTAPASVIVRAKDKERTIERTLSALRRQTIESELIVVDSGSQDATVAIARRWCDQLLEIEPAEFTYGRALNLGASIATAPVHFAVSAHCVPGRRDWIARALDHYQRADVAGAYGNRTHPDGRPLTGAFLQDAAHARAHPYWGFSNHASSWRASVWRAFPFDETLDAAEDKEWALRVEDDGWLIAFDPALWVDMSHVWRDGAVPLYRRRRREARALQTFTPLPPYGACELLRELWLDTPPGRPKLRSRLNYLRAAALLGKYQGHRARSRRGPA